MERFTKKQKPIDLLGDGTYCYYAVPNHSEFHTATAIANKLGKLEDLEEELGFPIEILIEALKNGIWTNTYWDCEKEENKDKLKLIHPSLYFEPSLEIDKFMFNCGDYGYYSVNLKDYKKTWWLKEDRSE